MIYLYLNIFTIFFPLVLSFDKKVHFWKKWYAALPAIAITAVLFIIWDAKFTEMGVWGFNPEYLVGIELFGLPLEEVLFFITVPYACLFIYETLNSYWPEDPFRNYSTAITYTLVLLLVLLGGLYLSCWYTAVTFLTLAAFIGIHYQLLGRHYIGKFYRAYLVHLLPFLLVNGVLTYLPVVWYNNEEIIGPRIVSIPAEDTMYSMLLLLMTVTIYELIRERKSGNRNSAQHQPVIE